MGQSNKCKPLTSTLPNLHLVSSVDSSKKATQLNAGRASLSPTPPTPLNIHIQVNTSGESSKSGVTPGPETTALAKHILETCPQLHLLGLMTIGAIARSKAAGEGEENEDFVCLKEERDRLEKELVEEGLLSVHRGAGGEGGEGGRILRRRVGRGVGRLGLAVRFLGLGRRGRILVLRGCAGGEVVSRERLWEPIS